MYLVIFKMKEMKTVWNIERRRFSLGNYFSINFEDEFWLFENLFYFIQIN